MKVVEILRKLVEFILSIFLIASWLVGFWMQLYGDFRTGLLIVILTLFVDVARQARARRKGKLGWLKVILWGVAAAVSLGVFALTIILTLTFGGRTWNIILLNASLSFTAFFLGAFIRTWGRWEGYAHGSRGKNKGN